MNRFIEQLYGNHPGGKEVFVFTLINSQGTEVRITNYGAIIMAIKVKKEDGTYNDIVLGFDEPQQYWSAEYLKNYPYYGAAIGRYSNGISNACINIDGKEYKLNSSHPQYQMHGGVEGFDKKVWDKISFVENNLTLQYISPDEEEGFPGELKVNITFELNDNNELSYEYIAETNKPTAVNLSQHTYFNLNNGQGTINDTYIKIHSSNYLEQDSNYINTGRILPVENTRNDFSEYNQTGKIKDAEKGIDVSYLLDKTGIDNVAAEAFSDEQDLKLEIYTTEPIIHMYNDYYPKCIKGKGGQQYTSFCAFCLETQVHPNAINVPEFPNTVLRPGEIYRTKTIYKITRK